MEKKQDWNFLGFTLLTCSLLLLITLFLPALRDIYVICNTDDDYSHGLLLPFIIGYIYWDRKEEIRDFYEKVTPAKLPSTIISLLLLIFGLFGHLLGLTSNLSYFSWLAFFPTTLGIIGLGFNLKFMIQTAGPFLLLIMAKPLPDSVVVRIFWPLQVLAAKIGAWTLSVLGVPVYLSGNVIEIPTMKLMVEEACSGMRSVMALLTLAFIMIFLNKLKPFYKVLLVLISLLLAITLNVFRVAMTGVLAHFYDPEAAQGFFHTFSGLIVFIVGLPAIYAATALLAKRSQG
jgi:exosortase